ncbi:MAG: SpoIIE family protein phosphatase [Acidobacteriota bacterium]
MEEQDLVLVVDDDPGIRRALERTLGAYYRLAMASNFGEALEQVRSGRFQAALVDVQLNDGDGYTLCREIRKLSPDTDVILMTGSISQPDEKLYRSLEEGAFYFLFKPFDRRVLRALLERCLRLQKERLAKEDYARELAQDLEKARRFQQSLLPRGPVRQSGWHAEGLIEQCEALGGDLYFCRAQPDGTIHFAVSDIVGHGVSAAMYAGMLLSSLNAARRRADRLEQMIPELLANIDFFEDSRYATLFYGRLFPDGKLRYFNAGHPPAFWKRSGGEVERLESTGLFLSKAFRKQTRQVREVRLAPGERILVYTDGVYEALDNDGREMGLAGIESAFQQQRGLPVDQALQSLSSLVLDHCSGRPLDDDLTLLLIERQ